MNYYDFSGGIVSQKSPYLMKTNELLELCNFDIEGGGLTVRAGTKKRYGPFLGEVQSIHKSLTKNHHELLFVSTPEAVELLVDGVKCNPYFHAKGFQMIHMAEEDVYVVGNIPRTLKNIYRRTDGIIGIQNGVPKYLLLEQLSDDYTTEGDFPSDLFGKNFVDMATRTLYYVSEHTNANRENIGSLLQTQAFTKIGTLGEIVMVSYSEGMEGVFNTKTVISENTLSFSFVNRLEEIFVEVSGGSGVASKAFSCPYIVWHPASMRYFAAGQKDSPTTLYISEPNDFSTFLETNLLQPHMHLGKITGLSIVEKSVVVTYEYGWAHYVGSDPTEDAQWSLLSIPDGTKYGQTVCLTPGSVSFLSENGLMSFSSSMLTVQMLYSPGSSLYKFLSKDKISLPKPRENAFAYYRDGNYYLVIDSKMYLYNFFLSAFTCYEGIRCSCITEDYSGNLLLGSGDCILTFCPGHNGDYDPDTKTEVPISYRVTVPVLGVVNENEIARCEEVVVKAVGMSQEEDCLVRLSSEMESREGKLLHTNHLLFGNSDWNNRYQDSQFSETIFPWTVSGNLFFLELFGQANLGRKSPLKILNIYLQMKKERNK